MKQWMPRLLLLAVLGAVALWGWRVLFPSPERVIRKRLSELAHVASFSPNEGPLAQVWNAQAVGAFFTPDVELTVDVPGSSPYLINGRDALIQAAASARSFLTGLRVEFPDINVALGPDRESAIVDLTAKAAVRGEREHYVQELKVTFKKTGRDWLIRRVETVKTLSRSANPTGHAAILGWSSASSCSCSQRGRAHLLNSAVLRPLLAKRLECVRLAGAFGLRTALGLPKSGSKLHALQTLRAIYAVSTGDGELSGCERQQAAHFSRPWGHF